jgi:hypothetical protein
MPSCNDAEQAFISVRSSERRNPVSLDYDLNVPLYNYNEAMRRLDRDIWRAMINKELDRFITMKIFREEVLLPGRFAIGSTWVFKFKIVVPSPHIAKGCLCAQDFSQISTLISLKLLLQLSKPPQSE